MKYILRALLPLMSFIVAINCFASERFGKINGTITTADERAAAFVDVSLEGTSYATMTDENGFFVLSKVKAGNYTLVISLVGAQTIEKDITVTNNGTLMVNERLQLTIQELQEVIITTTGRYTPKLTSIASRMIVPLKDIPQSVQILPSQIIHDRQIQSMGEAAKSMVGINTFSSNQNADYVMRGFRATSGNFAYNGIRGIQYQYNFFDGNRSHFDLGTPMYNIERIEVIKGPASVLFGTGNPGGIINFVTKKALSQSRYEADVTIGSFNQHRFMVDATGPINKRKNLLYRVIAGYEHTGDLEPNQKIKDIFLAPQLQWNISKRSSITYELNYFKDNRTIGFEKGIPAYLVSPYNWQLDRYPIRLSMIDPNGHGNTTKLSNELTFNHEINSKLKFTTLFRSLHTRTDLFDWSPYESDLVDYNDSLVFGYGFFNQKNYLYQSSSFINWQPSTGNWKHNIVTGVDYNGSGGINEQADILLEKYSLLNLHFSQQSFSHTGIDLNNAMTRGSEKEKTQMYGAYMQDLISVGDKWKVMISGRVEKYINKVADIDPANKIISDRDTISILKFLPRFGVVYQPQKTTAIYASYTQGYQPQISSNRLAGGPFPPEGSLQYEAGVKQELFNGKLQATIAAFYIQKFNVLTTDTSTSDINSAHFVLSDRVRSQGLEVSFQGSVTAALNIIVNYAYTDAKTKVPQGIDNYEVGRFPNAPYHNGNVWLDYKFSKGALMGVHLGAGGVYVGNRTTFLPFFNIPAYTVYDAVVGYRLKQYSINFNAYNITNRRYYLGSYGPAYLWPGNSASYRLSFNYIFIK